MNGNFKAKGNVRLFGDNINTDVIIPARYLGSFDAETLAAHCMEDIDPDFIYRLRPGDIIAAGANFGCGSSREHAPIAIKACGVSAVIAASFARIFYRNAINIGLPIIESEEASRDARDGDVLEIDFEKGLIHNLTSRKDYEIEPFPEFIAQIIQSGGLLESRLKS